MKQVRNNVFYLVTIGLFSIIIYWIISKGYHLEFGRNITAPPNGKGIYTDFVQSLHRNFSHPLAILLVQVVVIILVARIFGWICRMINQPSVIGEIIAGIALGPSLMGHYLPELSTTLFPATSLTNLTFLSQIGLILFMFVVGMELDLKVLRNKAHEAVVISHASIIIPFALGIGLAYYIYRTYSPAGINFLSFSLFIGIAMSITAFPVLARIVQERGLHKTKLGTVVITCAAADDITAWCILAAVIAIVQAGSILSSLFVIALAIIYVFLMVGVVRPFLKRVGDLHTSAEKLSKPVVAIFFITLIISAFTTEVIGIHALFGAFMAGVIMPDNIRFRSLLIEKVEDIALVLLLPLFFVFTGLRTEIGLLNDPEAWKITGLIIVVAVTGKFLGSAIAAKFVGQTWKESLTIGALMNTRGLMELVVLNIGYDLGVLKPEIFAMMVIMALVTTFMTGPLLDLINWAFKSKPDEAARVESEKIQSAYKILFSFSTPETGRSLLNLSNSLVRNLDSDASITALSVSPTNEMHSFNIENYEKESFKPVIEESLRLNRPITTLFKVSDNIGSDITEAANVGDYNLLLIGMGYSIFEGTLLGKMLGFTTRIINPGKLINTVTGRGKFFDDALFDERTQAIINRSQIPVGILIEKRLHRIEKIFLPVMSKNDISLIKYLSLWLENNYVHVTISDPEKVCEDTAELKEEVKILRKSHPKNIHIAVEHDIDKENLKQHDLMLISLESWKNIIETKNNWLSHIPSTLVIAEKAFHRN